MHTACRIQINFGREEWASLVIVNEGNTCRLFDFNPTQESQAIPSHPSVRRASLAAGGLPQTLLTLRGAAGATFAL